MVRELVLGFNFLFGGNIGRCYLRSAGGLDVEAHRRFLKGRHGRKSVVWDGKEDEIVKFCRTKRNVEIRTQCIKLVREI